MPDNFTPEGDAGNSFDEFLARYLAGERARSSRSIDISRFLSRRTQEVLAEAGRFALEHGHRELDSLHILRVMVDQEPAADAMRRIGVDPAAVAAAAEQRLPQSGNLVDADSASITPSAQRALFHAYQVARASGATYIDPEHLFFALVIVQDSPAGQVLQAAGVTPDALTSAMRQTTSVGPDGAPVPEGAEASATPMLDQFGTDLTALAREGRLDPVIGRLDEIEQTVEILSRRTKNNPVLVGEAGVGKTAIVEGLAQAVVDGAVPEQLRSKRVVSLDLAGMVAGTRYRGDFEERLTKLMDEISAGRDELIVFIDELHTVVGAGGSGESGGMDAGNILKPRLARGDLHMVGATTLKEYRRIEKDPALERRFQPVTVGEPSIEDAVLILAGLRKVYEEHHGVSYTDDAIRSAVELSARYVSDRFLPDKAIDLIDQAGARLRLSLGKRVDASALLERLANLEAEKNSAVSAEHYEDASRLRDEIEAVQAELDTMSTKPQAEAVVGEPEIAAVISRATGIPVSRIGEADRERLARLETELHRRVVGQDDAVVAVSKAVRRNRTGMGDQRRPVGSFLFLGPTGVGKTELAKALAASLFGDEKAMLRFDMSEFGERHTVARLVGAPPGYVGYDEAGQLTERVRRNPYSVLLFDEIEKAHPDVFNLLLQVLDDGRLTDGQGRTVDFRNTVVIMTSNLGSEFLASRSGALGFVPVGASGDASGFASEKDLRDRVMGKLREAMRPEFLNRIDEIVLFRKLDKAQLRDIVRLLLAATAARLGQRDVELDATDAAVEWIADNGYEPEYGARPLRRLIQRELDDRVADLLVSGELVDGGTVRVDARDGDLIVAAAAPAGLAAAA
ncbi:ATP-dependent Clp protease ATP-binding subunit [Diaminobutyricibacter tongyongensis]|uniref:ATP-dependent Clp protease ATP-binding subunit n=1 Tax=Leifsonia tongyongensis TaxID=1268043 RepID=A0A6L9XYB3_9MICO|nr:ATP-dependent Clp protease ATP-binding subunit [Diaminobutyricibacter tongyongensis]